MKTLCKKYLKVVPLAFFLPLLGNANDLPPACCEKGAISVTAPTSLNQWKPEAAIQEEERLQNFNPSLLYLLDQKQNIFFLRGNLPEKDGTFCYDDLVSAIKTYLLNQGIKIGEKFKILDLSFLNYFLESKQIEIEKNWIVEHPQAGCFWLNSLYGSLVNPIDLSVSLRDIIARNFEIDGLKAFIPYLKQLIETPCSSDFVIYIHCAAGKDRTGEASACYLMKYKGYSYKDAIALDQKIAGRELSFLSMNAIRWYAFYLRDIENSSWIGDIDGQ